VATTTVTAVVSAPAANTRAASTTVAAVVSAPSAGTRAAATTVQAVVSAPVSTDAGFYRYNATTQTLIPLYVYRWTGGVLKPVGAA
jgi:hypothetical protein